MRQRGFTLLEVLVVLVIVALVTGTLLVGRGNDAARNLREQAARLHEVLQLTIEQAVLQGREYGLVIHDRGYGFVVFDTGARRWEALIQKPLGPHRLQPEQRLELSLPGDSSAELSAPIDPSTPHADASQSPAVLLLSNGESTPFRLRLSHPSAGAYEVWSDGLQLQLREIP